MRLRLLALLAAGCAAPSLTDGVDLLRATDLVPAHGSDAGPGCMLGTADHCGTCDTVCPPGQDDSATLRACVQAGGSSSCDIVCRGEHYDVNGKIDDGCELEDLPIQDSAITAVAVALDGAHATQNVVAAMYGDARVHETPPTLRPNGRDDWYRLSTVGAGSGSGAVACLGITNFPADNLFEVCIAEPGQATFPAGNCKSVQGSATSVCVTPSANMTAGPFYVRVHKSGGSQTPNQYAIFFKY
jgi:hypothetical protein